MGAYQDTLFAYQGSGQFAYQGAAVLAPTVVVYGGDDAPAKRRRRRKERDELFREIESTVHALLHPEPSVPRPEAEPVAGRGVDDQARRAIDELLVLAQGQHDLLQRAAALRAELRDLEAAQQQALEQDDEDALIWMF